MTEKSEKRSAPRYVCPGTARIDAPDSNASQAAKICDLSAGGCLIELKKAADVKHGAPIELTIQSMGTTFRVRGTVASRPQKTHIGIKFVTMTERGRAEFEDLLSSLTSKTLSKAG